VETELSIRDHILALEQSLLDPRFRHSPTELEQLLADDFREYGSSGSTYSKRDVITRLQYESPQLMSLADFHLLHLASDVVLATYRVARQAPPVAGPSHSLRSSIWKLNLDKWQLLFHQGTQCAPPT
jgi:hypothetical protein